MGPDWAGRIRSQVIRATFPSTCRATLLLCKLQSLGARITTPASNLSPNKFQCCNLQHMLHEVELGSTFGNMLLQVATLKRNILF